MKIVLQYMGRRYGSGEKVRHVFRLADGSEAFFSKIKFARIGWPYEATKTETGLTILVNPTPADGGSVAEDEVRREWEARDAIVAEEVRRRKSADKLRRNPEFIVAAERLKPFVHGLTRREGRLLVEVIVERLFEDRDRLARINAALLDAGLQPVKKKAAKSKR